MDRKWPKVYAASHKDEETRAASRSGGIFTALSDEVLSNGGVIYGCILNNDFTAIHTRAEDSEERNLMRGSKYIQSRLGDIFKLVKKDLDSGKKVLFSGTSCQVAGLKRFLMTEYKNLLCVDIVCHGVPSKKIWSEYLRWIEKKNRSKIESVNFRNKQNFGWRSHVETIHLKNGKVFHSNIFAKLFYSHYILRPSCYECAYKSLLHPGDITIADYWGIENAAPEFDDNKGVSLILINSIKGEDAFEMVKNQVTWKQTKLEDSLQPPLKAPFPKPENREQYWKDFKNNTFEYVIKKYCGYGLKNKIKSFLKYIIRKIK